MDRRTRVGSTSLRGDARMSADNDASGRQTRAPATELIDIGEQARLSARRRERIMSFASPLGLLLIWEIAGRLGLIDVRFFPVPSSIIGVMAGMLMSGELIEHVLISLQRILLGFLLGGIPAIVIGIIMGISRPVRALVDPLIIATAGVLQIPPIYLDVGRSFKAGRWDTFRTIALPGALPFIMTGIKLGAGLALILIAVAEMVGAKSGIGYMIWSAWETFAVAKMYVGLFTIALIGFGVSITLREIERWIIRWKA